MELARALVRGDKWRADEARIRQISSLALEPSAGADAIAAIKEMEKPPSPVDD